MDKDIQIDLAHKAGLTISGENEDGEIEFIGTDREWTAYAKSLDDYEEDLLKATNKIR